MLRRNQQLRILLFAILALSISACKKNYTAKEENKGTAIKSVKLIKLVESNEALPITASGVLASETEINLSFKIGGIVNKLNAAKGASVSKGQVLAELDLLEINAQVVQARNSFDKAERDLKRVENLYSDSVATLEQLQDSRTGLEVVKATLDIAKFNQRYAKIISPIDGKILQRKVEEGELVSSGQPIYVLGSTGKKGTQIIKIGVADKHIIRVQLGDKAAITFDAFPERKFPATISEIAEEANPFTGTFDVELTLDEYHPALKNGFVGYVEIIPSTTQAHYKIPMTALIEGDGKKASVFISTDKKTVRKRQLAVQSISGDYFTVSNQQLNANEWLVLDGGAYLADKDSVTIIK
ncbi:MAG: efflux RND transporter periplasmic adaptor subunit [Cyclobacteriaceae bacterium]